jgi:hypothetical protein
LADEATIRKLENILKEKSKHVEEHTKVREKNDDEIR